jgi:hypothetical protein
LKKIFLTSAYLFLFVSFSFAQNPSKNHNIYGLFNLTAKSYLLNAPRPYVEIETDIPQKNKFTINSYPSLGEGYLSLPLYGLYGISEKLSLTGCIYFYNTAYSLAGVKTTGFGDCYAGIVYKIQESDIMSNFLQPTVKFPTASSSKGLGTGKFDFDLGASQSLAYKNLAYTLTADINFMGKLDFPPSKSPYLPPKISEFLDSVKNNYNYSYEQNLNISLDPTYNITDDLIIEAGSFFSRNMKLNFNYVNLYSDVGYTFFKTVQVYAGVNYLNYPQVNYNSSNMYVGAYYYPSDKVTLGISNSSGLDHKGDNSLNCEIDYSY